MTLLNILRNLSKIMIKRRECIDCAIGDINKHIQFVIYKFNIQV